MAVAVAVTVAVTVAVAMAVTVAVGSIDTICLKISVFRDMAFWLLKTHIGSKNARSQKHEIWDRWERVPKLFSD